VQAWNETDPEALITSGHASQRNLEMPFSRGNIVCREGKLYGYVAQERLINKEGYARIEKVKGKLIPLKAPTQPKLLFAVGNCLIGDIPDRNCMALAMMGFGKVNQMIGYTVTTWYGQAGWGVLRYWEQMGGTAPLNEAFYFNNVEMIHRLDQIDSRLPTLNWKVGKRDLTQMYLNKTLQKTRHGKPISRDTLGLCHDRDVVAFYGDPALEIRLDPRATLSGRRTISLSEKKGIWTATIHALADHPTPTSSSTPIGILFPHRLKNIKLLSGAEYNPLFADNFLLVTAPGPFKAGMDYKITFTAKN
jgi:zinc protease